MGCHDRSPAERGPGTRQKILAFRQGKNDEGGWCEVKLGAGNEVCRGWKRGVAPGYGVDEFGAEWARTRMYLGLLSSHAAATMVASRPKKYLPPFLAADGDDFLHILHILHPPRETGESTDTAAFP